MGQIIDLAVSVYADGPASQPSQPPKAGIRTLFGVVDATLANLINGLVIGGAVFYATRAALFADLARPAGTLGIVYNDSTPAYNGVYVKAGASGSGSWSLTGLSLPTTFAADLTAVIAAQAATQSEITAARGGQANLAARLQALSDAITALQGRATALETEVVGARGGSASLDGRFDGIDAALSTEASTRAAADSALDTRTDALELEVGNARSGASTLDARLDAADAALASEAADRSARDVVHDDKISAYGAREILDLIRKYARAGYDNVVLGNNNRMLSALRRRDDTTIIGSRGFESSGYHVLDSQKFRRSGIVAAVIDKAGRLISGQRVAADRHVLGAAGIETRFQSWNGLDPKSRARSGFTVAAIDSDNNLYEGRDLDGNTYQNGKRVLTALDTMQNFIVSTATVGSEQHVFSERRSNGQRLRLSVIGTTNANPFIEPDGAITWDQTIGGGSPVRMWSPADVAAPHRVISMREILIVGDSLVEQNYGDQLATLAGVPVRNMGKSGSTSRSATARVLATPMRLISTSGQIPASGSVQVSSPDGLAVLSYYNNGTILNEPGTWGGVAGTLSWNLSTGQMTFARTTAGPAISARGGLAFIPAITDTLTGAVIIDPLERIAALHSGRNNLYEPKRIFFDQKAFVSAIPTRTKRFVIVLPMPTKTEVQGLQGAYTNYLMLRDWVRAEWPNNHIDMLAAFIAAATGSTEDQAAVAGGYAPPSLMQIDETHPSATGRTVEATTLYNFINAKGWL